MSAASSLAAWGIVRAAEVVELAASVGLDLASAATLLEIESGGGHNTWGHDPVPTGNAYVKGAEVTRAAYEQYKQQRARLGAQGVGPCQLTYPGFQDQADALGGCWDWRCNVRVGFGVLLSHIRGHGLRDGFRRYNGAGPAAEAYADKAIARRNIWLVRLGDQHGCVPAPLLVKDDDDMTEEEHEWLKTVHNEITYRLANRRGPRGDRIPNGGEDTVLGYAANADGFGFRLEAVLAELKEQLKDSPVVGTGEAVDLDVLADKLVDRLVTRLTRPA
jgi:hypothetical protein